MSDSSNSSNNDVALINFGVWYNIQSEVPCDAAKGLDNISAYAHAATSFKDCLVSKVDRESIGSRSRAGICGNKVSTLCKSRRGGSFGPGTLRECHYEQDLRTIALWLNRTRRQLPRNVFWVSSTPQHSSACWNVESSCYKYKNVSNSSWRNPMARNVLAAHAPFVHFIDPAEVLIDRADAHRFEDITHWCESTYAYAQYVSSLLTTLIHHLQPEAVRR